MVRLLSRVGIGTYRMHAGSLQHEAALIEALNKGVRVIDTSPNYANGKAEELIGQLFRGKRSPLEREDVSIVSKFGFIQGDDLQRHMSSPWENAIKFTEDAYHCMDPAFMEEQLEKSLERLGTTYLDCYLVHNPELLLMQKLTPTDTDPAMIYEAREEFLSTLSTIFARLEAEVDSGRIRSYGVTSNSFTLPESHPHAIPFKEFPELANAAAQAMGRSSHSLAAMQMPANLLERFALASEEQNGNGAASWAASQGMAVMLNRPLSGFDGGGTWRFADAPYPEQYTQRRDALVELLSPPQPTAQELASMSDAERAEVADTLEACGWLRGLITDLDAQIGQFSSVMHFQDDLVGTILPMLNEQMEEMDPDTAGMVYEFFMSYADAVKSVTGFKTRAHLQRLREEQLAAGEQYPVPPLPSEATLEEFAVEWLLEHDSRPTVLVGLTDAKHVQSLERIIAQE